MTDRVWPKPGSESLWPIAYTSDLEEWTSHHSGPPAVSHASSAPFSYSLRVFLAINSSQPDAHAH